jgi:hypothetical protein
MDMSENQLFTVEEALTRLGQSKRQGCLLVSKDNELIHLYVQDGFIVRAFGARSEGKASVEKALHSPGATYTWLRDIQPPHPEKNVHLHIAEFVLKYGDINRPPPSSTETGKIGTPRVKNGGDIQFKYFLVPKNQHTVKHYLTKITTVVGRDKSSDLVIDNHDVSRRHCILDVQSRGLHILDLDSSNGTFVNGILVKDGYLNPGDLVELGPCEFIVNRESGNETH